MQNATEALSRLDRERASSRGVSRLHRVHWAALALSTLLALVAWQVAREIAEDRARLRFEHEAGLVADAFEWRLVRTDAADAADVRELMRGALDPARRLVGLVVLRAGVPVYDDEAATVALPGADVPADATRHRARRHLELPLAVGDGSWTLRLWSTPELERRSRRYLPDAVLASGLVIELLLVALFVAQARETRRARVAADVAAALSAELRARTLELERANADLERFACTASHDLKAPLQAILMQLQSASLDLDDDAPDLPCLRRRLARMETRAQRLQGFIDDVLAYSASGAAHGPQGELDVAALVREIGDSLGVADGRLSVTSDVGTVRTDAARLGQVLANLVANAFKYHHEPARARVHVACERATDERTVVFRVEDDGPGIAPEHHARVFEPFARLPARAGGTGIGLAIVRRAVEAVGGTLALDSSPGAGARFSFTWPVSPASPMAPARPTPPASPAERAAA